MKDATGCILDRNVAQLEKIQAIAKRTFVEEFSRRQSTALNHAEQRYRHGKKKTIQYIFFIYLPIILVRRLIIYIYNTMYSTSGSQPEKVCCTTISKRCK